MALAGFDGEPIGKDARLRDLGELILVLCYLERKVSALTADTAARAAVTRLRDLAREAVKEATDQLDGKAFRGGRFGGAVPDLRR